MPTGTYTLIYQQVAGSGPQGLLDDLEIDFTTGRWYVADMTGGTGAPGDEGIWRGSLNGAARRPCSRAINNPGGQIPGGVTLDIAPTLTGTETGATATEGAGSGSGFSADAFGLAARRRRATSKMPTRPTSSPAPWCAFPPASAIRRAATSRLTINGTTAGVLGSGIAYSYNSGTGVMTLTGVNSFANYEAALALVAYSIDGDNPDNYGTVDQPHALLFGVRRACCSATNMTRSSPSPRPTTRRSTRSGGRSAPSRGSAGRDHRPGGQRRRCRSGQ